MSFRPNNTKCLTGSVVSTFVSLQLSFTRFFIFKLLPPRKFHQIDSNLMHCLLGYITTTALALYRSGREKYTHKEQKTSSTHYVLRLHEDNR